MIKTYKNAQPPSSGKVYSLTEDNGLYHIEDETEYIQEGSTFGATDICAVGIIEVVHSKTGRVHTLITDNITAENIKFKVTATTSYVEGDTFAFNNITYIGKTLRGENLPNNCFVGDDLVFGLLDHTNHIVYIDVSNVPRFLTVPCDNGEFIEDEYYCYKVDVIIPGITSEYKAFVYVQPTSSACYVSTITETKTDTITVYFSIKPYNNTNMTIVFFKVYE